MYPPVALPAEPGLPWPARESSIITVGRFDAKKNLHEAVYLTDSIRRSFPDVKLYIVGLGSGSYRDFVVDLALKRASFVKVVEGLPRQETQRLWGSANLRYIARMVNTSAWHLPRWRHLAA